MLIQSRIGSPPICPGGFLGTLPENFISSDNRLAYTYKVISDRPDTGLTHSVGFDLARFEINCFSFDRPGVILLSKAINLVLQGFHGILPDADATQIYCCKRSDLKDFDTDPNARNFRRMLEYEISFNNTF